MAVRMTEMNGDGAAAIDANDLATLARRYSDQGMYDDAIHLYEMATKLNPGSVSLKINLARATDLKAAAEIVRSESLRKEVLAERGRDETDAAQYVGLAQYYIAKDQPEKAIELLEIAKLKTPNGYRPYETLARLYYSQAEWDMAHEEATAARALNPFDRDLAELEGRIRFELKDFDSSLDSFVDAFLLSTDQKGEASEPVRRMINTLKKILDLDGKTLNATIKKRVEQLQTATERLDAGLSGQGVPIALLRAAGQQQIGAQTQHNATRRSSATKC